MSDMEIFKQLHININYVNFISLCHNFCGSVLFGDNGNLSLKIKSSTKAMRN